MTSLACLLGRSKQGRVTRIRCGLKEEIKYFSLLNLFSLVFFFLFNTLKFITNIMTTKKGNAKKGKKQGEGEKSELEIMEEDELEFVSMATLKTMLSIQQSTMRSLFESFLSSVNSRVDNLVKTVESVKSSLELTQKDIADFDPRLAEAEKELESLQSSLVDQGSKMEYLENQSRRNNIRVSRIPEEPGETWEKVEEKVKPAVKEKLD